MQKGIVTHTHKIRIRKDGEGFQIEYQSGHSLTSFHLPRSVFLDGMAQANRILADEASEILEFKAGPH